MWYLTVLVFAFGACIGSFLNVCIHRIPLDESVVSPRSRCPKCATMIAWYDNLPLLSWVLLGARCRHCRAPISPRYVLVEFLTAALFLLVWLAYGIDVRTPIYWLVIAGLILGMFVDFEHMIIPDRVTIGGMILGPLLSFCFPAMHTRRPGAWLAILLQERFSLPPAWEPHLSSFFTSLLGLAIGFGCLYLVGVLGKMVFRKDAMGFGDVKLLGGLGAFFGWQGVLFIIMVSSLLGSVVGLAFIAMRHKEWQSRIPYGPYLALAAVIWLLWGTDWWEAYMVWLKGG